MKKWIEDLNSKHSKEIRVCCDEYHAHSIDKGCFTGPQESIDICKLVSEISRTNSSIKDLKESTEDHKLGAK